MLFIWKKAVMVLFFFKFKKHISRYTTESIWNEIVISYTWSGSKNEKAEYLGSYPVHMQEISLHLPFNLSLVL